MITLEEYKKTLNILYIEDDKIFIPKIKSILEKFFKSVFIATNGEEALELFKINNISLIISDINMPKMDGLSFLKNLRKINSAVSFIFLTARKEVDTIIDAIQFDISNYILKPIDLNNFLFIVNKTVEKDYKKYIKIDKKYLIKIDENYTWNKKTKTLLKNDISVKLTKKELLLIDLLLSSNDKIYSLSEIIYHIWDDDNEQKDCISSLKNIISRLRNKIPQINIENVYGVGYKIKIIK
jgi:two-component system, OmpR family, response regulator VanR